MKSSGVCKEAEVRLPKLKSSIKEKEIMGNAEKYRSYREAWSRINKSREEGFYFEAITLEESIINDRLVSYLNAVRPDTETPWEKMNFVSLITAVRLSTVTPVCEGNFSDLFKSLNSWRLCRNKAVHGFAKSATGTPTVRIEDALQEACCAAEMGAELAKAVLSWHTKQKAKSRKDAKASAKTQS